MRKVFLLVLVSLMFTSCLSTMFAPAEYVPAMDSLEAIEKTISNYETSGEYLKKFRSKDKMGNRHEWIIYDNKYFSVDGIVYVYKFHELMTYSLVLTSMKGQKIIDGSEDIIGFQGFASPVNNPDTIVSFIFASELFAQKGYRRAPDGHSRSMVLAASCTTQYAPRRHAQARGHRQSHDPRSMR